MGLFGKKGGKKERDEEQAKPAGEREGEEALSREPQETDREELLNNFLSRIGSAVQSPALHPEDDVQGRLPVPRPGELAEIEVPPAMEEKIRQLRAITSAIEKRPQVTPDTSKTDFSRYRVPYITTLNPAQLAAVVTTDKPVLVIAGAGSGKTRIIVHRVSWLIENGAEPGSILLLTFTRKAAREMLDRVETLLHDESAGKVTGGTFHSFASFILRKYASMLGLAPNFTIIDTADSEDIVDLIRTELKLSSKDRKFPKKSRIYDIISYSRNRGETIPKVIAKYYSGLRDYISDIELIFSGYTRYKKLSRIFDFDDLMEVLRDALRDHAAFRQILQKRYAYVMVDEFQDTNVIQKEIVDFIAAGHRRIMVVGDDAQSIYAFRGANYENILRFPETYPECAVVRIEENYRSNQKILDFTNELIDHARIGYKKRLFTRNNHQVIPVVRRVYGEEDEAVFIVDRMMELIEEGVPPGELAVLNRADWHNRYIQVELNKRGIPYVVVGGFKFNERMHIKDIIAYLRLTYNPSDAVAWHRVLKYIGGIGKVTASGVIETLQQGNETFSFEAFSQRKFYHDLLTLGHMLAEASQPENSLNRKVEIIRDYYAPILKSRETDYLNRMMDIDVLVDLSRKYKDLDRFLSDFALDPPSRRVADQSTPLIDEGEEKGKITLSTVHSAKGLEWYAVFIPHALDGMFPSNRAVNLEDMEEERRLFYVACSRAKEELYIAFPRYLYSYDAFFHLPSRFLLEMDPTKFVFTDG